MRWFALILCFVMPTWVTAESLQELFDTLNETAIEIAGSTQNNVMRKQYILWNGTECFHQSEYAMNPGELRAVRKVFSQDYNGRACGIKGKVELGTSSGKGSINAMFLHITEVSEVVDFSKKRFHFSKALLDARRI